ncbi:MAG: MFS transporter [Parafilimonas terrae]|nr:MFS transporter [Parafilimonas terrae]
MTTTARPSSSAERDAIFRRAAVRIIPFAFVCYLVAMIDRLNVGFAKLQFMADLHLSEAQFGFAASLLYAGYILFEIPSNLMAQRSGVGAMLLRIMVLWGITTMLLALAQDVTHFYVLRFLIGLAEAGFLPGILLYLTYWFPEHLRGRMTSLFVTALPVSGIVGGPLAGWIMTATDGAYGYQGWRYLFLIEGAPAILLGIAAYFLLPKNPREARWLDEREREILVQAVEGGTSAKSQQPHTFATALTDLRVWGFALAYFLFYCLENALLVWLPSLLRATGSISIMTVGWIGGAISVVAMLGMQVVSFSSDRMGERRWHVIGCGLVSGACFLLLGPASSSIVATTALLAVASVSVFAFLALFWTIPSAYLRGTAAAGGLALISSVGALGGVVSPILVGLAKDWTGSFDGALACLGVGIILGMPILYVSLRGSRVGGGAKAMPAPQASG